MTMVKVNDAPLKAFKAELLDYTVDFPSYKDSYLLPAGRIIPVKLKGKVGLRKITMTLDFSGESAHEITKTISKFTARLMDEIHLVLPDGFHYWCVLDGQSAPKEVAPWILQVKYTLVGFRHGPAETIRLSQNCRIFVDGNFETPAIVKLVPATDASTVSFCGITVQNVSGPILIDGVYTTIKNEDGENVYKDSNMTEWPKLQPGNNDIQMTGVSYVELTYYPVFW